MGATGWASAEQKALLQRFAPDYMACRVAKKYKEFWRSLFAVYLTQFPLVEEMYPGRKLDSLTEAETIEYTKSLGKLQARLKEWYRWQYNPRSRSATAAITSKVLKQIYAPRKRGPKQYEVFARLYPEKVAAAQKEWCDKTGSKGNQILGKWHSICKDLLENATDEEKHAVEEALATTSQDDWDDRDPEEYPPEIFQRYLTILPTLLSAVVEPATRKAGAMTLVTIVAPVPEKGGQVDVQTIQFGDKTDTPLFAKVWTDYEDKFVNAVTSFAIHHEFPPEVCARRSMFTTKEDSSDSSCKTDASETQEETSTAVLGSGNSSTPPPCPADSGSMAEGSNAGPTSALHSLLPSSSEEHISAPAPRALRGESNSRQSGIAPSATPPGLRNGVSTSRSSVGSTLTAAHAAGSEALVGSSPTMPLMQPITSHSSGGRASTAHFSDSSHHDGLGTSSPLSLLPPGPPISAHYQTLPPHPSQARHRHRQLTPRTHADPLPDPWTPSSTPTKYPLRVPTPQVSWRDREYWGPGGLLIDPLDNPSSYGLYTLPRDGDDDQWYDAEGNNGEPYQERYDEQRYNEMEREQQRYEEEWHGQDSRGIVSSGSAVQHPSFVTPAFTELFSGNLSHPLGPAPRQGEESVNDSVSAAVNPAPTNSLPPHPVEGFFSSSGLVSARFGGGGPSSATASTSSALSAIHATPPADDTDPRASTPLFNPPSHSLSPTSPAGSTSLSAQLTAPTSTSASVAGSNTSPSSTAPTTPADLNSPSDPESLESLASASASRPSRPWTPQRQASSSHPGMHEQPGPHDSAHASPTTTGESSIGGVRPPSKAMSPPPAPARAIFGGQRPPNTPPRASASPPTSPPTSPGLVLPIVQEPVQDEPARQEPPARAHPLSPPAALPSAAAQRRSTRAVVLAKRDERVEQVVPIPAAPTKPVVDRMEDAAAQPPAVAQRRSTRSAVLAKHDTLVIQNASTMAAASVSAPENKSSHQWYQDIGRLVSTDSLGLEWLQLVDRWKDLEKALGYGEGPRAALSSKLRPEEWSTWVRGGRNPQERPKIGDPQEFGDAVLRWWRTLKGNGGVGTASWTKLTKSGPNGISSLVLLLLWWGQAAISGPGQWLGDSRPEWRATVQDVTDAFVQMLSMARSTHSDLAEEGARTRGSKRGRSTEDSVDAPPKRGRR